MHYLVDLVLVIAAFVGGYACRGWVHKQVASAGKVVDKVEKKLGGK